MTESRLALLAVIGLSVLTAIADIMVKKAAELNDVRSFYMVFAAVLFGGSAYGWFFALRHINLATLGGVYSLVTILLLVLAGVFLFEEKLGLADFFVLIMSLSAILMFWRHL